MNTIAVLPKPILLLAALPLLALSALADQTWTGAYDNEWDVGANWSGTVPGTGDFAIYNNLSTANLSNWLGQSFSIEGIVVSNVPAPVSINPSTNTLTLTPPSLSTPPVAINMSNAMQSLTVAASVALGNNQSWYVTNGQTLSVPGVVSGSYGLYKDGFGSLYLTGTNSFTGSFTNNGGPVWINNSAALGAGAKTIYIANNLVGAGLHLNGTNGSIVIPGTATFIVSQNLGAVFNEAGTNAIDGGMYVYSGGGLAYIVANAGLLTLNGTIGLSTSARPFQVGGAANGIINGPVTAALSLTKTDSGTWTLNHNDNTYTGVTTIQGGTLALGPGATIPNTPSIMLLSNAVFDVSAVTNSSGANVFTLSPSTAQTLGGSGTVTGSVAVANAAYLVPGGTNVVGTLSFSNDLTLNGSVTVPFELNTPATPGGGVNDLVNVAGELDPEGATITITPLSPLPYGATYRLFNYGTESANPFNATVTTVPAGTRYTFALADSGGSPGYITVNVTGSNSNLVWSGGNGATWDVNGTANWDTNTQTFYPLDAVTFDDSSANNTVSIAATVQPASVTVTNNTASYLFQGAGGKITGITGLTKSGTGTLTITASTSDFTGPITINGGVLSVNSVGLNGAASTLGAGSSIVLNGGTFQCTAASVTANAFNRSFVLGANGGTISVGANGYLFVTNTISGPGSLTKLGATKQLIVGNTSPVAGVNTYTGNTYINQYELQIRNASALGYGTAVVANGADLAVGGGGSYGTVTNNINLNGGDGNQGAGTLQVNDNGTAVTFGGTINLLATSSVGTVNNGAAVTFIISGPIIGPGALKKWGTNTVTLTCPNNNYSGGTLVSSNTMQLGNGGSCGSLGSGAVTNNGTLAYNHSDTLTNSSAISGTGNLTHTGGGTLALNGNNTYSGATTVNGGTLLVNGALAGGAVSVASGATLGGYGTIGGTVTVHSGGTLALGASIGTLTVNNTLNLAGTNVMKINNTGGTLSSDLIQGMTTLSYGGVLEVTATGNPLAVGDSFKLFNAAAYAGNFSSTNLPALAAGLFWDTSGLTNNGTIKVGSTAPTINSFTVLGSGKFQLTFSGPNGANYRIWANTNVAAKPVTNTWSNLFGGTFGSGTVTFTDTQAPNFSRRFYVITMP
jgi:autotransporter-associated beta strand protein